MERIFTIAAGMDVHRDTVVVSIRRRSGESRDSVETRTFETFNDSLLELAGWLKESGVEAAGLESTGVYWKPVVRVLQTQLPQLTVWLVNPLQVKKVAGRKTDVADSQWLSKLVMYGLVAPSFLASPQQEELRRFTRHRTKLVADQIRYENRIIKELEASGVKLRSVCSDVMGKTSRAIIAAMLDGETDPDKLAALARGLLRRKIPQLRRAVQARFTPSTAFVLRQQLRRYDDLTNDISALDAQIGALMQPLTADAALLLGVPGIDDVAAAAILAEIGADMSVFASSKKIAAWAGLSPGSEESAGKSKKAPTRKGDKYLRTILVQVAWAAVRTKTSYFRKKFGRLARLGPKKAIVAIARSILVALYHMLRDRLPYREPDPALLPPPRRDALARRYIAQLQALGLVVTVASNPATP